VSVNGARLRVRTASDYDGPVSRTTGWPRRRRQSLLKGRPVGPEGLPRGRPARERIDAREREAVAAPLRAMLASIPERQRIVAHLGPTNSGKTYAALQILASARSGAYGGPLRLMAQEVHEGLRDQLGEDVTGLRTGEERINPEAPFVACTTELLVPRDVVVIDEVHWLADRERGSAWTRALLTLPCRELHLVGSADILPALRAAFPELEVRAYDRLAPLTFIGAVPMAAITPGTAVIAFSRKAVLALARELSRKHPGRVGVLYGAMPAAERRRQAERFRLGEFDVLCATDVLGHGLNLPIRTILFAESRKWNGTERTDIEPWEVAQIAGRAGRFGMHDSGEVGVLVGHRWAEPRGAVIEAGLHPRVLAEDGLPTFRRLKSVNLGPEFEDVADHPPQRWPALLVRWETVARALVATEVGGWVRVADVQPMVRRLSVIGARTLRRLHPEDAWSFALAPVDADAQADLLGRLAAAVSDDASLRDLIEFRGLGGVPAGVAEEIAGLASLLRWFTRRWPGKGGIIAADADRLESIAADAVGRALAHEITSNTYGQCETCGKPAIPGRPQCDPCFRSGARRSRSGATPSFHPRRPGGP
jgi:ATP-dependent RNA helicase SUPV3L1/SUV3